ncbi:MAG: HNH endonuclease, partial [bacterium]|nr:HNH endonuclease [bacterium]
IPWAVQGNTDIDDMVLLCSRCHHKVHDDRWQVRKKPSGEYYLKPPPKHLRHALRKGNNLRRRPIKQRK